MNTLVVRAFGSRACRGFRQCALDMIVLPTSPASDLVPLVPYGHAKLEAWLLGIIECGALNCVDCRNGSLSVTDRGTAYCREFRAGSLPFIDGMLARSFPSLSIFLQETSGHGRNLRFDNCL